MERLERTPLPQEASLREHCSEDSRFETLEDLGGGILYLRGENDAPSGARESDGQEFLDDKEWRLTSPLFSAYLHGKKFYVGQIHAKLYADMQKHDSGFQPTPTNTCFRLWNTRTHEIEHVSISLFVQLRQTLAKRALSDKKPTIH